MAPSTRRNTTRSRIWPETRATIYVNSRGSVPVNGAVADIGSRGMFLKTTEYVPLPASAVVTIAFDPDPGAPNARLTATGEIVRRCAEGVGICFTTIDVGQLQKCIIARMNRVDAVDPDARYRLPPAAKFPGNVYPLRDHRKKKSP